MFKNKLALAKALTDLAGSEEVFKTYFTHGSLEVQLYQPDKIDHQSPHDRDEVYIIASGEGRFFLDGKTTHVSKGDFLFVPAGIEHRFTHFSEKFSTWVLFYGPEGGERAEIFNALADH